MLSSTRLALIKSPFIEVMNEEQTQILEQRFTPIQFKKGKMLFSEGDIGDGMYILVEGKLTVVADQKSTTSSILQVMDEPGELVGEIALLTGQPRSATVIAKTDVTLLWLSSRDFRHLTVTYPEITRQITNMLTPRVRKLQLNRALTRRFGALSAPLLDELYQAANWRTIDTGEVLSAPGHIIRGLYLMVNGRLRMTQPDAEGTERVIREIDPGDIFGTVATVISDDTDATIYATRQSYLVYLTNTDYQNLLAVYPHDMLRIMTSAIEQERSAAQTRRLGEDNIGARSIMLLALSRDIPLQKITDELSTALPGNVLNLQEETLAQEFGVHNLDLHQPDGPLFQAFVRWCWEMENSYDYLIYTPTGSWDQFEEMSIRQSDYVLLFAWADDDTERRAIEEHLHHKYPRTRIELVLLQRPTTKHPQHTHRWLKPRQGLRHHHIQPDSPSHIQRLARWISGRTFGLVLSGGGARGFAHVGVLRAFEEAGFQADFVGGTSMGAYIGALHTSGWTYNDIEAFGYEFVNRFKLFDYTLPMVSFFRSHEVNRIFRETLTPNAQIEDLWRTYFCVSSNISKAHIEIHDRGTLWKAVRASAAIPTAFVPVVRNGDVLVDGSLMNNFPVDIMYDRLEGGKVIGVDVSPFRPFEGYNHPDELSGWRVALGRFIPGIHPVQAPMLMETVLRALEVNDVYHNHNRRIRMMDILIQPEVKHINSLAFKEFHKIVEAGYRAGQETIQKHAEFLKQSATL